MHTKEERWREWRDEHRKRVAEYYRVKRTTQMMRKELGMNSESIDPWKYDGASMREAAQLLRRLMNCLDSDKKRLGLTPDVVPTPYWWEERILKHGRRYRGDVPGMRRKVMSVDQAAKAIDEMLVRQTEEEFVFPKFYKELVQNKGIMDLWGSTDFMQNRDRTLSYSYTGPLAVVAAREIKADWLSDENIRAFKVVVLPEDQNKTTFSCSVGYAAISTLTRNIKPAFGRDISKAVSLCRRRVKAEVLKQMGV